MPPKRPGSVTSAGVLSIILGSLGLLCGLCNVGNAVMQQPGGGFVMAGGGGNNAQVQAQNKMLADFEQEIEGYRAIQVGGAFFSLFLAVLMLVGGIGVLNLARWARTCVLVSCVLGIIYLIFQIVFQITLLMPIASRNMEGIMVEAMKNAAAQGNAPPAGAAQPAPEDMAKVFRTFVTVGFIVWAIVEALLVIYLLIIVWLLNRRHVRVAFAGHPLTNADPTNRFEERRPEDHDDDNDWNRPPRRDEPEGGWGIRPGKDS